MEDLKHSIVFLWQLNCKEPRIEFKIEREKNGIMAFLAMDISIQRQSDKLITKVYRKGTHTQDIFIGALITQRIAIRSFKRPST